MYGEALERVCLDLRMKVGEHTHDVKIKVHNTKCSLDVAGFHDVVAKRFDHLDNLTVGEYFAKNVITKIVEQINANIDITELNNKLRAMANEGKTSWVQHQCQTPFSKYILALVMIKTIFLQVYFIRNDQLRLFLSFLS